ncbi:MAG: Rrf2 family transcriptional regulator [Planctomycetes bacterium]|nr:Rrf2 family transcriptional regulator [Planctomycetota bacterium]
MNSILKISEAASLALHAMAYLAAHSTRRVATQEIAESLHASRNHLSKVLQRLNKAGLVASVPGPGGGVELAEEAEEVSLIDIYEVIDGPLRSGGCLLGHRICKGEECVLGGLVERLSKQTRDYLSATRLSDLKRVFRSDDNDS